MCTHVCRTVSYCCTMLRQLRSIRYLVSASIFQSLVTALVLCRLDWGNSTLVGLPVYLQWRLQSVQYAAARLIFRLRSCDHITEALVSLQWLRVPERITYKVAVLMYRALTGDVPQYLWQFVRVADVPSRHRLQSSTSDDMIIPAVWLTSIGLCSFPVAGARIWNTLPLQVTSASSLTAFKLHLKLHLFCFSFAGLSPYDFLVFLAVSVATIKILIDWLIDWLIVSVAVC